MSDLFAALDLGSNSFHLLLARRVGARFEAVERLKEKVQLLSGFDGTQLHPAALARGEACLARFAQRLAAVPRTQLRMAGTHALRVAANRDQFRAVAERIMGVRLEVVSGAEEARLVNLGVAHHIPYQRGERRLVVDVGGGSTELAWSAADAPPAQPQRLATYKVGCVALTDAFLGEGTNQPSGYAAARNRARAVLSALTPLDGVWEVIGTSGTVESVQSVLAANGWGDERITRDGLAALSDAVASGRWLVQAGLPGLAPERVDIFAAGLAVVDALFEALGLAAVRFVDVSLQDGLVHRDVEPPDPGVDLRERAVTAMQQRHRVDLAQAARVRRTALALFDGACAWWPEPERWRDLLGWACDLHELGAVVAARHYHRHGAYLLQHAAMPAFSRAEQAQLALLVRGHRRAFPGLAFRAYDDDTRAALVRLLAVLRVAVILQRSHTDADSPRVAAQAAGASLEVVVPAGWQAAHPLSSRELEVERDQLASAGIRLDLVERAAP